MSINMAIIGYGGMGEYHHRHMPKDAGITVTSVYDIKPERMQIAQKHGLKPYESAEKLLSDRSVDLVLVTTPNNFHKEYVIKALKAGKHVICEKPVGLNSAELLEMMAVAKESKGVFTIHQNRRWDRDFLIVKKVIEDGMIGKPFYIESRVQGSNGIPGDWRCVKEAGGGMLYDWGVHLLDQLLYLVKSPVTEVYAHLLSIKFQGVDDNFRMMLKFENGISALVQVDTYCFEPLPRWHISGDSGTAVVRNWECNGSVTKAKTVKMNWEPSIVYTAAGPTRTMAPRPVETIEKLPLPAVDANWNEYYYNLRDVITEKAPLAVKPEECLRVLKVIDAAFQSSEQGICVKCNI